MSKLKSHSMENQTITRDNLKKIHDIACSTWKTKLESCAKRDPFSPTISFSESEIQEMFNASDSNQKKVLDQFFKLNKGVKDKIKSFKDALNFYGLNASDVYSSSDTKDEIAFKKLKLIIKALNEGWKPEWTNHNEYKYWNYFQYDKNGVFSFYDCYYYTGTAYVPSALYLKSRDLALYAVEIGFEEYKDFYAS